MPKFGGPDFKEVCNVCFQLKLTLDNSIYWKSLHDLWAEEHGRRKRKLGDGKDYFGT
jgi:hypothetical protein